MADQDEDLPPNPLPHQLEGNQLVHVYYPGLERLVDAAAASGEQEGNAEAIPGPRSNGKRRLSLSNGHGNGNGKRARLLSPSPSTSTSASASPPALQVLTLHLHLTTLHLPPSPEKQAFIRSLSSHSSAQPLRSRVKLAQSRAPIRGGGGGGREILVSTPESTVAHLSGVKLLSVGEGGVLSAVLLLEEQGLLSTEGEVVVSLEGEGEGGEGNPTFRLTLDVTLLPTFFSLRLPSNPKRLFVERLFPPTHAATGGATVDLFYSSLRRAPRTSRGVPVSASASASVSRNRTPETEEERTTRLRREAKGKGRAVDLEEEEDGEGSSEAEWAEREPLGPEDELLYPTGLKPTLMPFQSRSVRWMLGREGVRVRPSPADEEGEEVGSRAGPSQEGEVRLEEEDEEELESEVEGEEVGRKRPRPVLEPLGEEELVAQRRGPLWERIGLRLPGQEGEQTFWLNRVTSSLSLEDPGVRQHEGSGVGFGGGGEEDVEMKEEDGEDEEEEEEEDSTHEMHWGSGNNGLLAEEVGLGKTVEVLSLILLHPDKHRVDAPAYYNPVCDSQVQPTGLTLIIAPAAIAGQWASEIEKHAPKLRVLRYESIKKIKETQTAQIIAAQYDIILTTFDVLRKEVVLARKPHERALRSGRESRHRYRRSLLVQIDFLRIVMDEAQMVGDSVSATSETAALIPRKFSWAVTSTPLKRRIEDLQGLLAFLRVEPFGESRGALTRLVEEVPSFVRLCQTLGARTLKAQVDHELVIPEQSRYVVPVTFGAIEQYWYDSRYAEALDALGLLPDGTPKDEGVDPRTGEVVGWTPSQGELNRLLVSLRQVCCHPQIGKAAKDVLGNVLKTVDDVLAAMRDKAVGVVLSDQRTLLATRVKRAQWLCYDKEECERFEEALEMFGGTLLDLEPVVEEVVRMIGEAWELRKARLKRDESVASSALSVEGDGIVTALSLGLADQEKAEDHHLTEKDRALITNLGALRTRLRELLSVKHKCYFFSGSAYYNMGKFPEEEAEMYAKAEQLRGVILSPYEKLVDRATRLLLSQQDSRDESHGGVLRIKDLEFHFGKTGHGLLAVQAFEDAETTTDVLNGYAELMFQWRSVIFDKMKEGVSIAGEDATGEEYAERAESQEVLNCYLEAYEVLLAEWRHGITGERNYLAEQLAADIFAGEKKNRWDANPLNVKRKRKNEYVPLEKRRVPSIEQGDTPEAVLRFELLVERVEAKGEGQEETEVVPFRHIVSKLKEAAEGTMSARERALLQKEMERLREEREEKEKVADRLRGELTDVTKAFNARLTYFAQLQVLSDEVADPDFKKNFKGFPAELALLAEEEEKLEAGIEKKLSSRRYLETLHADNARPGEETTCVVCSDTYTEGVLTTCGHLICSSCFTAWIARNRSCALCRRELHKGDWEVVKYRQPRREADGEDAEQEGDVEMLEDGLAIEAPIALSTIDSALLTAIEAIDTVAPLSSKSDLIVKHVAHIRRSDPTAKILVFSAWNESLSILMNACHRNGIGYVRLEASGKKEAIVESFHSDPDVAVFFLHTKSQSAGLNLTCARFVFLVEPLLHPSLEIQAIARVHRIGQVNKTTVFQYYVANSVDQRVAELRARQGTSLFLPSAKANSAKEAHAAQKDMASKSALTAGDEGMDDEDESARCLLAPEHYLALQRALLPARLRLAKKVQVNGDDEGVGAQGRAGQAAMARAMGVGAA